MELKIIYEEDTDIAEYEALCKGYRNDVIVILGDIKYRVSIISMIRLQQDFDIEQQEAGYYMVEPNMIIVNEVTKKEIQYVINEMYKSGYFERIGKCEF